MEMTKITKKIKLLLIIFFFGLFIISCSDKIVNEYDDNEILKIVYSDYKYPKNFYTEIIDNANIYYVNTLSIKPLSERTLSSIELSTNNRDSAYQWSELTSTNSSHYMTFVEERETNKYFEFRGVRDTNPSDIILHRVHKYSYLSRSMYDSFNQGEIIGKYNVESFELDDIRELIEYMVFVQSYNNGSFKALNSNCDEMSDKFIHTITEISITFGDWDMQDEISIYENQYTIDKSSGYISLNRELIKTILGHYN